MASRGVVYMVWGEHPKAALDRSLASLKHHHPELATRVLELPPETTLLDKAKVFDLTPFEETLFLDADTMVLGRLDFGFAKALAFGLACTICECPWGRRYGGLSGDIVEYNTGVLFFTRKAKPVFSAWRDAVATVDSSIVFVEDGQHVRMPLNDQAGFAKAVDAGGIAPFVLPLNWNFRPKWHKSWFGPLKIWHDYEPPTAALLAHNTEQAAPDSVVRFSVLR